VISYVHSDWSEKLSEKIILRNKEVTFHSTDRKETFISTVISKIVHRFTRIINPLFKNNINVCAFASNEKTIQLQFFIGRTLKKKNYDRIIAHNLGAFYPAMKIATKCNAKLQLDIEDFHPGESPYFNEKHETNNRKLIMRQIISAANNITYASPLIMKECLSLFEQPERIESKSTVINNCFSEKEFEYIPNNSEKVKFVWFSQNISFGRGLEEIIPILKQYGAQIELHLIGNLYKDFKTAYSHEIQTFITIHKPMKQTQLNQILGSFDIGLALEPGKDLNNNIALSNKIWAYLQSGLFILASDTKGQIQFLKEHNKAGVISSMNTEELKKSIEHILENRNKIRSEKIARFEEAKQYAWEKELGKLKKIVE
jgi:glycosyltransferase involved in cell wall biosynthesis